MKPSVVVALASLTLPSLASAQVDPARVFYAVAFTHGTPHNGVITAQSITAPFGVVASAERGTLNGTITLDPVRGLLYGGSCCTASLPIQAYDPATLTRVAARDITVTSSGSFAIEVDAPRRVMFHYDTVLRTLRAISLAEGAGYGTVVATTTLTDLPAEPTPTSVGDQIAVDTRAQRLVATGGDGGPVLVVDVAGITATGGSFGAVTSTGQRNRSTGNSGGAVAVDEVGRRLFFIPATGTVRVINADPPFAMIGDIAVASMATNDCGLSFDGRTGNLYVGRGASAPPVVIAFPSMSLTPFATGPGDVPALSFTGGATACVDRDGDGFAAAACAAMGARVDCNDGEATVNPDATETCNGRDDDCDGLSDEGFCRIEGMCFTAGQSNPANACQTCAATTSASAPSTWSPASMGTTCRAAAGACDVPEVCDGTGAACKGDRAPHLVRVSPFTLQTTEVTRIQYAACVLDGKCPDQGAFDPRQKSRPQLVSDPEAARSYCRSVGMRLPTEAEFEFAARADRAGKLHTYPWGRDEATDKPPTCDKVTFAGCPAPSTYDVGTAPGDLTDTGIHDLAGSVPEWVEDNYDPYMGCASRLGYSDLCWGQGASCPDTRCTTDGKQCARGCLFCDMRCMQQGCCFLILGLAR